MNNNRLKMLDEVSEEFHRFGASHAALEETYWLTRGQGGLVIYWRKHVKGVSPIATLDHDRFCGISVQNQNRAI